MLNAVLDYDNPLGGFGAAMLLNAAKKAAKKPQATVPSSAAPSSAAKKAGVKRLQAALAALGKRIAGDTILSAIKADGAIGPKTVVATNRAFTLAIGPGQSPAQYRTGKLTSAEVAGMADTLARLVETEVARRGTAPASAVSTSKALVVSKMSPATTKAGIKRLQAALAALGKKIAGDTILSAVKADGSIGPKTVAATNRAFTLAIGPGQSPAQYRTGKLTSAEVAGMADTLARLVETEAARRTGAAPGQPTSLLTPAGAKANIKRLQAALAALGKRIAGDKILSAVKADGAIGPKTVAATNRAFTLAIGPGQAPAQYRTGKLTSADVTNMSYTLATLVETEVSRRGGAMAAARIAKQATKKIGPKKILKTASGDEYSVQATDGLTTDGQPVYALTNDETGQSTMVSSPEAAVAAVQSETKSTVVDTAEIPAAADEAMPKTPFKKIVATQVQPSIPSGGGEIPGGGGEEASAAMVPSQIPGAATAAMIPSAVATEAKPVPTMLVAGIAGGAIILGVAAYVLTRKKNPSLQPLPTARKAMAGYRRR